MRKSLLPTILAAFLLVVGATPASATPHAPSLHIKGKTGAIYWFDGSPNGTGPSYPAATVTAEVKNCPAGDYELDATLVQDGVSYYWATTALGAGFGTCDATGAPFSVSMGFYGGGSIAELHPGRATAHFSIRPIICTDGICSPAATTTMVDTRVVRIR